MELRQIRILRQVVPPAKENKSDFGPTLLSLSQIQIKKMFLTLPGGRAHGVF